MGSLSPRMNDLRRRLATSFFFEDLTLSSQQSCITISLTSYIKRLETPPFAINSFTDYRSLASLLLLLDVSIDDGRFTNIDLKDKAQAAAFDMLVDALVSMIRNIPIKAEGASHPSRHAALLNMDIVALRLECVVRSRRKPRENIMGDILGKAERKEAEAQKQRDTMSRFLATFARKGQAPAGETPV